MLERMYQRWCTAQGYKWTVLQRQPGEEAGLKTLEVEVEGRFAYGYLKGGVGGRRHEQQHHPRQRQQRWTGSPL